MIYLDLTDQFAGALGFASALSLPYLLDEADRPARGRGRRRPGDGDPAAALRATSIGPGRFARGRETEE